MRTVRIDFTNQSVSYPDGTLAGRRGEHLMTQLIISLPEEMGLLKLNIIASPSAGMATRSAF